MRKLAGGMPVSDVSPAMLLQIRASIKALFPNRDCFTLVRPMSDERQLNQLESIDASKYRPEFNKVSLPAGHQWVLSAAILAQHAAVPHASTWPAAAAVAPPPEN